MNLKDRLLEYISSKGLSVSDFEKKVGLSNGAVSKMGDNTRKSTLDRVSIYFPDLNINWLRTGEGLKEKNSEKSPAHFPKEGIPLIPFSAMAGALKGEMTALEYECEHYIIPSFSGADFLMPVKGNSMTPTYISGDIVACQRVPMSGLFFQWNKPYVLDTSQGAIIKRIKPGSDKNHVLIVSDNTDYDPFELPYEDIYAVALVIGVIRLE